LQPIGIKANCPERSAALENEVPRRKKTAFNAWEQRPIRASLKVEDRDVAGIRRLRCGGCEQHRASTWKQLRVPVVTSGFRFSQSDSGAACGWNSHESGLSDACDDLTVRRPGKSARIGWEFTNRFRRSA
jgi:hypothetical protein